MADPFRRIHTTHQLSNALSLRRWVRLRLLCRSLYAYPHAHRHRLSSPSTNSLSEEDLFDGHRDRDHKLDKWVHGPPPFRFSVVVSTSACRPAHRLDRTAGTASLTAVPSRILGPPKILTAQNPLLGQAPQLAETSHGKNATAVFGFPAISSCCVSGTMPPRLLYSCPLARSCSHVKPAASED